MKPRTELSMQLYQMLLDRGYPENLCELITRNLNTDYTATRMIGYLSHYSYLPEVEVVDDYFAYFLLLYHILSLLKIECIFSKKGIRYADTAWKTKYTF